MMIKRAQFFAVAVTFTISAFTTSVYAALVTHIDALDIGGTLYDVTFHTGVSFDQLWDGDGDGVFSENDSLINEAPTFWGDPAAAEVAAIAIILALGSVDTIDGESDIVWVPYALGTSFVQEKGDYFPEVYLDLLSNWETSPSFVYMGAGYASFVETVPVPSAVWLFASGLFGLFGVARKKTQA